MNMETESAVLATPVRLDLCRPSDFLVVRGHSKEKKWMCVQLSCNDEVLDIDKSFVVPCCEDKCYGSALQENCGVPNDTAH